jgi:hypothetical protein
MTLTTSFSDEKKQIQKKEQYICHAFFNLPGLSSYKRENLISEASLVFKIRLMARSVAQVVKSLHSKHEALSSKLVLPKKKKIILTIGFTLSIPKQS